MHTWQVHTDLDITGPLDDAQIDTILDQLAHEGAAVSWVDTDFGVTLTIETSTANPARAGDRAMQLVGLAVRAAGVDVARWRAVEVLTAEEADRRLAEPNMPDLVGTPEAGEILGVSRQRVHQLRAREDFPPPILELATGPLWLRASIEAFDREVTRKPGRPAAVALTAESTLRA